MQAITLSPIRRTHPLSMYWWPIQSRRQLLSAAAYLGGMLLLLGTAMLMFLPPRYCVNGLIGGAIGGVYFGVYRVLPARMALCTRGEARHFVRHLLPIILSLGYRRADGADAARHLRFCNKAPRWQAWDEQNLEVSIGDHEIVIAGPIAGLELLRQRLTREMTSGVTPTGPNVH